jgi:hypothetical protein
MATEASTVTIHEITVVTLTTPIPVNATDAADKHRPFSAEGIYPNARAPLNLSGAEIETLRVSDDDARLDGIFGSKSYDGGIDANQVVAETITLGYGSSTLTLQPGQAIGFDYSAKMFCVENGEIIAAYEIAFPRIPGSSSLGDVVGAKYSMLVMPISYTRSDGKVLDPAAFDSAKTYYYGGKLDYNQADHSIEYVDIDCFATGTLIDTPDGPRAVETFRAGDLVVTRDHGPQPLVWAGACRVDAARLDLQPNLRPIRIAAGALGPGQPARDLLLSPQHRVLVRSAIAERMFGSAEILVAAKHLVGLPGIDVCAPAEGFGYHHLLFSGHQVVRSEGAWTESLFLGPRAMLGLDPAARREVMTLFPGLAEAGTMPEPARRLLSGREGRKLAERHGRNGKPLVQEAGAMKHANALLLPA